jgi:hypothetical protein
LYVGNVIQQRKDFVLIDDFTEYVVVFSSTLKVFRDKTFGAEIKPAMCKKHDFGCRDRRSVAALELSQTTSMAQLLVATTFFEINEKTNRRF